MYETLTFLHNVSRWLVLCGILVALVAAARGMMRKSVFGAASNSIRHWSATLAHVQLVLGMLLYFRSPAIRFYWSHTEVRSAHPELGFFSLLHPLCMLVAVTLLSVGSGLAKRRDGDAGKHRTILIWYGAALLIMLLAVPWPFSPLAARPYWR